MGWSSVRSIDVPCTVDIEQTPDSLHAYVELQGFDVGPGDVVQVQDAPVAIGFGDCFVVERRATVIPANAWQRAWTQVVSLFELTELFEVSFTTRRFS